jgi:hypothetical protein
MTNTSLPPHLERIGRQLTAAAHDLSPAPCRSRRRAFQLIAVSTTGLAAIATAAVLAVGATTGTPPAFAVTRHHDGSVSVKINRRSGIAGANRKLAAMGIHERLYAVPTRLSGVSHPLAPGGAQSCLRDKQTGGLVQVFFPSAAAQKAAVGTGTYVPSSNAGNTGGPPNNDTFVVIACPVGSPGNAASGNTGNTGGTGSGNAGNSGGTLSGPTRFAEPVNSGTTSSTGSGNTGNTGNTGAG